MFPFFAGFAAGLLHVFSGPDHLAAVAPLVTSQSERQQGWRTGFQWGIGHTIGVLLIACLLLVIREQLPIDAISAYSERIVGIALIVVGAWGIRGAWVGRGRSAKVHSHAGASFGFGVLHGLAGSSHLFGVLPALAFATRFESILYLAGFGAGAIAGMATFSAAIGLISGRIPQRHSSGLLYASSAAALVIGGFWLVGR